MTHAACCLLSVPCGVCGALQGDPCAEDCTAPSVCTCDSLPDPCCTEHYAERP